MRTTQAQVRIASKDTLARNVGEPGCSDAAVRRP